MADELPEGITTEDNNITLTDEQGSKLVFADGDVVIQAQGDIELREVSVSRKDPILNKPKKVKPVCNCDAELIAAATEVLDHYLAKHIAIHPRFQRLCAALEKIKQANS